MNRECRVCGTLFDNTHRESCPKCRYNDSKPIITKLKYAEYNEKTGAEVSLLMAVPGDCKFDIESKD